MKSGFQMTRWAAYLSCAIDHNKWSVISTRVFMFQIDSNIATNVMREDPCDPEQPGELKIGNRQPVIRFCQPVFCSGTLAGSLKAQSSDISDIHRYNLMYRRSLDWDYLTVWTENWRVWHCSWEKWNTSVDSCNLGEYWVPKLCSELAFSLWYYQIWINHSFNFQ